MKVFFYCLTSFMITCFAINELFGFYGLWGEFFNRYSLVKILLYMIIMAHLTISAMSLSFHRHHTHRGVEIHPIVDLAMQTWLWLITSMGKRDWVSVHLYHHAHSDQEKDPHSPVQKGFWRVFTLGVFDYSKAKSEPAVVNIRNNIKLNRMERFFENNLLLGPCIMTFFNLLFLGPAWGTLLSALNFLISPLFAVGGVNALAHYLGYRNHKCSDNSRNIGFLFLLNFIICGELDHNNHHAKPKSCSFRHRWFEFDIGYCYLIILEKLKLATILNAFTPRTMKNEVIRLFHDLWEKDHRFKKRAEQLCQELEISLQELRKEVELYLQGQKTRLQAPLKEFAAELKRTLYANYRLKLSY